MLDLQEDTKWRPLVMNTIETQAAHITEALFSEV